MSDRNEGAAFNGQNERSELREQSQQERQQGKGAFSQTENELSTGSSVRNFADVNGTTFGEQSSTSKFSNLGDKNQDRKGIDSDNTTERKNNSL